MLFHRKSVSDSDDSESVKQPAKSRNLKLLQKNKSVAFTLKNLRLSEGGNSPSPSRNNKSLYNESATSNKKVHLKKLDWKDRQQIYDMKMILRTMPEAASFTSNVLKLCINQREERLA